MQLQRRWRLDLCPWNLCGSAGFSSPSRRLWGPALQSCDEFEVYTFQLSLKDLALLAGDSLGACKASLGPQDGGSKFVQQEGPRFLTFPLLKLQLVPEFICQDQNRQEQEEAAWHRSRQKGSNSCTSWDGTALTFNEAKYTNANEVHVWRKVTFQSALTCIDHNHEMLSLPGPIKSKSIIGSCSGQEGITLWILDFISCSHLTIFIPKSVHRTSQGLVLMWICSHFERLWSEAKKA